MVRLFPLLLTLAALLAACGTSGAPEQSELESQVSSAMATLPYSVDLLDELSTEEYVVFRAGDGASVDIAYGGESKEGKCPRAPRLPIKHRRGSKPFAAAGPEPLICLEHDAWRPGASEGATTARLRTVNLVANALCEEIYKGYESFACFD
jgi:hypothetical protein